MVAEVLKECCQVVRPVLEEVGKEAPALTVHQAPGVEAGALHAALGRPGEGQEGGEGEKAPGIVEGAKMGDDGGKAAGGGEREVPGRRSLEAHSNSLDDPPGVAEALLEEAAVEGQQVGGLVGYRAAADLLQLCQLPGAGQMMELFQEKHHAIAGGAVVARVLRVKVGVAPPPIRVPPKVPEMDRKG